jgi:DNA/RNA endonuclease YhcR with UshA esterase domain
MKKLGLGLAALGGLLMVGTQTQAHHAVAGVYDLNKEITLEGQLTKLNFVNPHASMHVAVPNADGTVTEWILTTASIQTLTRQGLNKTSIKPGESLKIVALPARNGNPAGFIRRVELGDKTFNLVIE